MPITKPSLPRFGSGQHKHTDTVEFLSPGVLISYRARAAGGYPTPAMKLAINQSAIQARNIVRIANDMIAKVVLLRRPESKLFRDTMARHMNLIAGDLGLALLTNNEVDKPFSMSDVFTHDRRWVLEKLRQMILSLSYHLNTGVYLIDMDTALRTVQSGATIALGTATVADGYVYQRGSQTGVSGLLCGFRNGEIHIDFNDFPNYSLNSCARIIIHEAAHKFVGVGDTYYAKDGANYPPSLENCINNNADSLAWTAVSLATGAVRMSGVNNHDFNNCPGAAL
jgi:hypothetical protein